ncbi:hypothetical protein L6164_000743 [Bauhinia variegata]|uniref:Uncharacterized protein n=1 Tax=Bauhinia variegata TaxID=167791 RepID=A0ACB9QDD9_BAUVA|nr:hypothetical protein L6164_000743 [Bauhinia variegata]
MVEEGNILIEDKSKGSCPHLCWRLPLSRKAKKKTTNEQAKSDEVADFQPTVEGKDDMGTEERKDTEDENTSIQGDAIKDPILESITMEIAKRCADLPDVIVSPLAKALSNKEKCDWEKALKQLESFDENNMQEKIHSALEIIYHNLESDELKSLFFLIALQGRYYVYKYDLLIFSVGLGLFKNVDTLEEARNRLHALTKELKDSCLLIEDENLWIAVHDIVREAAVSFRGQKVFSLKAYSELKNWPERDHLRKCQEIYLPWCYMDYLPDKLESPELQALALENQNKSYMQIPDSFFEETGELKVLDISGIDCTPKPPKSLGFLKNLTSLYLFYCMLEDIAIVGELKNLQILSLSKSNIQELPREIGQLHQLRLLDLDRCSNLKVIPPKVISSLKRLEELYMGSGFVNWDIEGNTNASLTELGELQYLTSIDLPVPDAQLWPVDLFLSKLERFRIFVGDWSWDGNYDSRRLKLKLNRSLQSDDGVKMLLKDVDELTLHGLIGVMNVLHDLDSDGYPLLQHLTIQNNDEIRCIAMSSSDTLSALPNLESLALENLNSLEYVCQGPLVGKSSFSKLKNVEIKYCEKLAIIFPASALRNLHHLENVTVSNCSSVEEIFEGQEPNERNSDAEMRIQLRSLCLIQLPRLKQIWNETILQGTFNLENLEKLYVEDCPVLEYVIPTSVAEYLVHLKELKILTSPTTVLYGG